MDALPVESWLHDLSALLAHEKITLNVEGRAGNVDALLEVWDGDHKRVVRVGTVLAAATFEDALRGLLRAAGGDAVQRLRQQGRAVAEQYDQLREVAEALLVRYGAGPCRFDTQGYCAEHASKPCAIAEARAVLG